MTLPIMTLFITTPCSSQQRANHKIAPSKHAQAIRATLSREAAKSVNNTPDHITGDS
jgi:hypothetical protein